MTATLPSERTTGWELAQRERIRAFRAGRYVLITAVGHLPTPGWEVDIQQSPQDVFPQQFDLLRRERPGLWPAVLLPYRHAEVVPYPVEPPTVTVHHRDGADVVEIEACGEDLAEFAAVVADRDDEVCRGPSPAPGLAHQRHGRRDRWAVRRVAGFHHLFVKIRGSSD